MSEKKQDIGIKELAIIEKLNKRTTNVCEYSGLDSLEKIISYNHSHKDFKTLRNCGNKSNDELIAICEKYKDLTIQIRAELNKNTDPIIEKIHILTGRQKTILNNLINSNFQKLDIRSFNVISKYLGTEYLTIKTINNEIFSNKNFNIKNLRNVGKKSHVEISNFLSEIEELINIISVFNSEIELSRELFNSFFIKQFGLKPYELTEITKSYDLEKGFPVFKTIDFLIENNYLFKNENEKIIFQNMGLFNQKVKGLEELASEINLTRERTRQIRVGLLKKFNNYFSFLIILYENNILNTYAVDTAQALLDINEEIIETINKSEYTNFNIIFVNRIFNILLNDYTLIGDDESIIFSKQVRNKHIWETSYLIKNELVSFFDFEALINDVYTRKSSKIDEDYIFNFQSYILNFEKADCFNYLEVITDISEHLIFNEFSLILDINENILFKKNTHKNLIDYIFEIIKNENKPLKVSEIYNIIQAKHPNVTKSEQALRGSLQRDSRIMHFGRNSTYGLRVWEKKDNIKGGSMHDISEEYMLNHNVPIHINELVDYVGKYRKKVSSKNLLYNLKSAKNRRFVFFKNSYIGSVNKEYGEEWVSNNNNNGRKSWEENFQNLLEFCNNKNRLPNNSSNEKQLYNFLHNQKRKTDDLNIDKRNKIEEIINTYESLSKRDRKKTEL